MTHAVQTGPVSDHARLALLYEVSQTLGSSLDLSEVLNRVMDAIIQLTGAERGFLMLQDRNTGQLELRAGRHLEGVTIDNEEMEISLTVLRRVVERGESVVTSNAQEDPRFSQQRSVIGFALRSIMCAPLRVRGRVIGAVYVDNRVRTGMFSQDDLGMLAAFANQAAIAIENARLFTLTDQALSERVEELSILQTIDRELNESLDFDRVMGLALDWAVKLTGADSGMLMLLEASQETAKLVASYGGTSHHETVPLDHPVLSEVLKSGEVVLRRGPALHDSVDGTPAAAQAAVPVIREGRVIGLIVLESSQANEFDDAKVSILERLADHAAIAIENARLYNAVQAANDAKSAFISVVSHELRLPMTSIKGYTDMLKSGSVGPVTDMQREFLTTIRRNVDRMNVLVSDLSDINRIESGRLRLRLSQVNLAEAIDEAVDGLRTSLEGKNQTVTVNVPDDLPRCHADHSRVVQVVANLLSNAIKYSPPAREIRVEATKIVVGSDLHAQVRVIDAGFGISPEDQAQLFTQFFRSERPEVRNEVGWGLGLSIVKMLVEAQGGVVWFTSSLGAGSVFAFTLPTESGS